MAEQKKETVDIKEWSIFKRLAKARHLLSEEDIPKSGYNKFAKFPYHELKDILPPINKLNDDWGIVDLIDISEKEDVARLVLYNVDDMTQSLTFTIPYREAEMLASGGKPSTVDAIQRLGSTVTYIRRYLYMLAYNVVESDAVDGTAGDGKEAREVSSGSKSKSSVSTSSKYKKADKQPETAKKTTSDDKASPAQLGFLEKLQGQGKIGKTYRFGKKNDKGEYEEVHISKADASKAIDEAQKGKDDISWTMPTPDVAVPGYDDKKTKDKEQSDSKGSDESTTEEDEALPSAI